MFTTGSFGQKISERIICDIESWVDRRDSILTRSRVEEVERILGQHEEGLRKNRVTEVARMLHADRRGVTLIVLSLGISSEGEKTVIATSLTGDGKCSEWVTSGAHGSFHSRRSRSSGVEMNIPTVRLVEGSGFLKLGFQ